MRSLEEWTKYLEEQEQSLIDSPAPSTEPEESKERIEPVRQVDRLEPAASAVIEPHPPSVFEGERAEDVSHSVVDSQTPSISGTDSEEVRSFEPAVPVAPPEIEPEPEVEVDLFSIDREIEKPDEVKAVPKPEKRRSRKPDEVAQASYKEFRETREELLQRLLDPEVCLEDAARILNVCPTTVRRYTNRGILKHHRTAGNQRRFRLSDVLSFMEKERHSDSSED